MCSGRGRSPSAPPIQQFQCRKKIGIGIGKFDDGKTIEEGTFADGLLSKGKRRYPAGVEEEGTFNKAGELHGPGRRKYKGSIEQGEFKNGIYQSSGPKRH